MALAWSLTSYTIISEYQLSCAHVYDDSALIRSVETCEQWVKIMAMDTLGHTRGPSLDQS